MWDTTYSLQIPLRPYSNTWLNIFHSSSWLYLAWLNLSHLSPTILSIDLTEPIVPMHCYFISSSFPLLLLYEISECFHLFTWLTSIILYVFIPSKLIQSLQIATLLLCVLLWFRLTPSWAYLHLLFKWCHSSAYLHVLFEWYHSFILHLCDLIYLHLHKNTMQNCSNSHTIYNSFNQHTPHHSRIKFSLYI